MAILFEVDTYNLIFNEISVFICGLNDINYIFLKPSATPHTLPKTKNVRKDQIITVK
jgi:hypothetical protein